MADPDRQRGKLRAITSLQNPSVKAIRALEMRKVRRKTGLFTAEGASLLLMAQQAGWPLKSLLILAGSAQQGVASALLQWARASGAACLEVSAAVLSKLAAKENPQTMLGVFEQRWVPEPPAVVPPEALWLALEGVRDPGNLGTIIRTLDAVGGSGAILVGNTVDPYAREAVRASMGSIFNVPLLRLTTEGFLAWRAGWRGEVVAGELGASEDFRARPYRCPVLVVMGSEGAGLSRALAAAASRRVKIPMAGRLDSLNLAVATALILYEVRRERLSLAAREAG
jgi:TrmH family RNA methyltransferase